METTMLGLQTRRRNFRSAIDKKSRTVEFSFSSEEPYERSWGVEILSHQEGHVDMGFIDSGNAPLLAGHDSDPDNHIGVVEKAWVQDGVGRARVRFGRSDRATTFFQDVVDGIRKNVSVGYRISEMTRLEKSEYGPDSFLITNWAPKEISLVSIPADETVGLRADEGLKTVFVREITHEDMIMGEESVEVKIDEKAIRDAERVRQAEILAIGKKSGMEDEAEKAILGDVTVDQFRARAFDKMLENAPQEPAVDPNIGMSEKDVKRFSFIKLIRALADPSQAKHAGFELEASRAFEDKTGRTAKGAFVPHDVLASEDFLQRDLSTDVGTAGGYLVETSTGSFIDMLRNSAAVMRLGTRVLTGLTGDIDIPKQTGGATAYWVNEGSDLTESQQTLGQIRMSPKTVGCYTDVTRRMMLQSSVDVENFIRQDFALQMGIAIDLGALDGDAASGEPRGIINTTGVGSVTLDAANTPVWGDIVDLETAISADNALFGSLAYLTNATIVGNMKQTAAVSGEAKFIYEGDMLNGYRLEMSNNVPAKYIIFANWADMIIGMWSGLDVTVDTNSLSTSGGVRIVCFQDIDIAIRHAESFAVGYKA